MSLLKKADPVKLVSSIISAEEALIAEGIKALADAYGKPDYVSNIMAFDYTEYYKPEMGEGLKRRMVSFERLINPEDLPVVKTVSNEIEARHTLNGKRRMNIDPGYISTGHLILATGKPYAHRPYLKMGVYADIALIYRGGTFRPQEWTYPDYKDSSMIGILKAIRDKYLKQSATFKKETVQMG